MASKELIEKVARSIKNADREVFTGLDDLYEEQAKAAISTILDALKEPTREVLDELKINDAFTYQALETRWNAALNASPLGEQSE